MPSGKRAKLPSVTSASEGPEGEVLETESLRNLIIESIKEILPELVEQAVSKIVAKYEIIKKENDQMKRRIQTLEDEKHQCELEVSGVPMKEDEDTSKLARNVLELLKLDKRNLSNGVLTSYRLPVYKANNSGSKLHPKIIIKLANPYLKKVAFGNRIKHPIIAKDLGFQDSNSKIYINERLRPEMRSVFYKVLQLKREQKVHAVWTQNQQVMTKVSKDDAPEVVADIDFFIHSLDSLG